MQRKQRKSLTLKTVLTITGIAVLSLTLLSVIVYLTIPIHMQLQTCIFSPNCHQSQKQTPWVAPALQRKHQVFEPGGSYGTFYII